MTESSVPPLAQIYFYMTEGCNLACKHCWINPPLEKKSVRHPVLPVRTFERAIDEALPLGLAHIKLTGGEPLLHPEIKKCLEIADRKGVKILLETNGVLLEEEIVSLMSDISLMEMSVSLDGVDAETHDEFRGVKGAFQKTVHGIELLSDHGIYPQVITSLTRRNMGQIGEIIKVDTRTGEYVSRAKD